MNKFINQSNKILCFVVLVLLLQACASKKQSTSQESISNQQNLEFLLQKIQRADTKTKNPLLVQASGLLILEQRYEKAQELLIRVNQQQLTPLQMDDFRLFYGETLLALDAAEASLNQLLTITASSKRSIDWQLRYNQSLSDSYLANANYFEAAKIRIQLEDIIDQPAMLSQNNEKIWFALSQLSSDYLQQLITGFNSQRVNGWIQIVHINKRWGYHPKRLLTEIEQWKLRYPLHPAFINQPASLQRAAMAKVFMPVKIAVLLPLTGKNAQVANIINDGILAAHYQSAQAVTAPEINFYDTGKVLTAITSYQKAIKDGADFIIGPLTKPAIESILKQEKLNVPMLALNRLDEQQYAHPDVFQFGLSPEDEAIQAAHYAFEKGYRRAIAFIPDSSEGRRAEIAFQEYFEQLGGKLISVQKYKHAKQLKNNVQNLLGINKSVLRKNSLQQLLGRNLEFVERRRQDADFIFLIAKQSMGRSIKPFIDYYYAHDLPVIATSSIFSGKKNPQKGNDLNRIEFPYIPLLLSELPEYQAARNTLAVTQPELLGPSGRFFALGFDSYKIISQLSVLRAFPEYRWNGLSGELGVDESGLVHRYLTWAKFSRGVPHVTKEREIRRFDNNATLLNEAP